MKLAIEDTGEKPKIDGIQCGLWKGTTERGTRCFLFVYRVAVAETNDTSEFDEALKRMPRPTHAKTIDHMLHLHSQGEHDR